MPSPFLNLADTDRRRDIFSFPRGANAGIFFHDLFENLDYGVHRQADWKALIDYKLSQHGFAPEWQPIVWNMVANVLSLKLSSGEHRFCLQEVQPDRQVREMEFYFPLHQLSPMGLQSIFKTYGRGMVPKDFPARMGQLTFAPTRGFMKGFIDLSFSFNDRYYLVDWKSNYLGASFDSYRGDHLNKAMAEANYFLQYHLYTLAFHRHLSARLPGYRYDRHFGGVFYIFLRGVDPTAASETGIFFDRPVPELLFALDRALIDGNKLDGTLG